MPAARLPVDEVSRLLSLHDLDVLDSAPEPEFDALVRAAASICGAPVAFLSLLDADREWFKSGFGVGDRTELPREQALCAHAILSDDDLLEVPDLTGDARFADNPFVTEAGFRFHAAAPLRLTDGARVGCLCVLDPTPRRLDPHQRELLILLAVAAVKALESRQALDRLNRSVEVSRQNEAMFRVLSETSPMGVFRDDAQGQCIYVNDRYQEILGLSLVECFDQGWSRTVHPDDLPAVYESGVASVANDLEQQFVCRLRRRDGSERSVQVKRRPVRGAGGLPTGYVGTVEDATERLAAVQRLAADERQLRWLYEATPAMLHSIDADGRIVTVSDRWLDRMGYTREEVVGRLAREFAVTAADDDDSVASTSGATGLSARAVRLFAEGRLDDLPLQLVTKSGQLIEALCSAVIERDAEGRPLHGVSVLEDVTGHMLAERALDTERRRLKSIVDATLAGIWECNVVTGEGRVDENWAAMVGYSLSEVGPATGRTWSTLAHPDDLVNADETQRAHIAGEIPYYEVEARMRHRDGHWVWVLSRGRIITWTPDGRAELMVGTHLDLTVRKQQEETLRQSERFLARTSQVAGVGGWEFDCATDTLFLSDAACRMVDCPPGLRPTQAQLANAYPPETRALMSRVGRRARTEGIGWDVEMEIDSFTGRRLWLRNVAEVESVDGVPVRLVGSTQDITALVEQRRAVEHTKELLRVTLQSIGDAVVTTDAAGCVTWLNPIAERMTGWPTAEARGRPLAQVFHIVHEETRLPAENPVDLCLQRGAAIGLPHPTMLVSRDGTEYGIEDSAAPICNDRGDVLGAVLVFHDVTETRRLAGEMSHRAMHDALTGLVNRSEFEVRLARLLERAQADDSQHALLCIDLDQFKLVNDTCGHSVGDQLLQQVARILTEAVRSRDTVARLGGDEFAVILEHCAAEQAEQIAQKICDVMNEARFVHDTKRFRIGTSIGLVPLDKRWDAVAGLMQAADTSCYAAKEAGRNRVHIWFDTDATMRARYSETRWATRVEQALDENCFVLFAQRIEPIGGSAEAGLHAEVLLRLVDADGSLVAPGAFLPAAERFHLASRLDRWVMHHAIEALVALPDIALIEMLSINLSGKSIGDRAFHRHALELLAGAGDAICRRLCLEITETAAVTNLADAALFIAQARALGVRIALDDFGAGASSFGYLKTLKVDVLKIDGQFIRDVLVDPLDDAAVRCFVDVARVLGLKTVAEFVDSPAVLARLGAIGVDYAQGYLLHRPAPIGEVIVAAPLPIPQLAPTAPETVG